MQAHEEGAGRTTENSHRQDVAFGCPLSKMRHPKGEGLGSEDSLIKAEENKCKQANLV